MICIALERNVIGGAVYVLAKGYETDYHQSCRNKFIRTEEPKTSSRNSNQRCSPDDDLDCGT